MIVKPSDANLIMTKEVLWLTWQPGSPIPDTQDVGPWLCAPPFRMVCLFQDPTDSLYKFVSERFQKTCGNHPPWLKLTTLCLKSATHNCEHLNQIIHIVHNGLQAGIKLQKTRGTYPRTRHPGTLAQASVICLGKKRKTEVDAVFQKARNLGNLEPSLEVLVSQQHGANQPGQ